MRPDPKPKLPKDRRKATMHCVCVLLITMLIVAAQSSRCKGMLCQPSVSSMLARLGRWCPSRQSLTSASTHRKETNSTPPSLSAFHLGPGRKATTHPSKTFRSLLGLRAWFAPVRAAKRAFTMRLLYRSANALTALGCTSRHPRLCCFCCFWGEPRLKQEKSHNSRGESHLDFRVSICQVKLKES